MAIFFLSGEDRTYIINRNIFLISGDTVTNFRYLNGGFAILIFVSSHIAAAADPTCFSKLADSAKNQMERDASVLLDKQVRADIRSINSGSSGSFLEKDFPGGSSMETFEVRGVVLPVSGGSLEGSPFVNDSITVYVQRGTCEITGTRRSKSKSQVGCYGGCSKLPGNKKVFSELYADTDAPQAAGKSLTKPSHKGVN